MTLRISEFAVMCGLGLLALPGVVQGQAPRYQSPLNVQAPQPQLKLPTPAPITPNGSVVEDVIVHVNDQIISRSDLERSVSQLEQENQQSGANAADVSEREKNLLRDMIDQQLLLSRAKETGVNVDADVIRRLDDIRKSNHMDSLEDLEKAARSQGVSFEDFKAQIRNSLLTQRVVQDEVGRTIGRSMTPGQMQTYYDAHKQEFAMPEQIRLSEILVPTPADANDAVVAQAQAKADDLAGKLKAGANFEEAAKANSGGPTASQGGELGEFKRGALPKVFEDQTFDAKVGDVTSPIRSKQGFVILKVTGHTPAGVPPLQDVQQQIEQGMYEAQMQPALRAYLTKLREDGSVEVAPGFVDTGASPRQTKLVNTSYTPPATKKIKKQEKRRFESARAAAISKTGTTAKVVPAVAAVGANGKPKKIKREKVRYGQAPRNALPAGPQEGTVSGTDKGIGAASVSEPAPGTAIAPLDQQQLQAQANADPFAPKAAPAGKTRYSDRAKTEKVVKEKAKVVKAKEKAAETPAAMTTEESAAQKMQAAPLGLNGDTAKKKVKKKKVKGAQKERLQNKAPAPAAPAPEEIPARGPNRGTPLEGTPAQDKIPSAPAPAPVAPAPSAPVPAPTTPPAAQPQ